MKKECSICSTAFEAGNIRAKYCNNRCALEGKRLRRLHKRNSREKNCKYCQIGFTDDSRWNQRSFCSKECSTRLHNNKRHLNLSLVEYREIRERNECEICGTKDGKLCIDHCHTTGKVRGLLCHSCNTGIGHFRENPDIIRKAIKYIKENANGS